MHDINLKVIPKVFHVVIKTRFMFYSKFVYLLALHGSL